MRVGSALGLKARGQTACIPHPYPRYSLSFTHGYVRKIQGEAVRGREGQAQARGPACPHGRGGERLISVSTHTHTVCQQTVALA